MIGVWSNLMTIVMEHCDEKRHGALLQKAPWSIVMTRVLEHCDDTSMENGDEKSSGAL